MVPAAIKMKRESSLCLEDGDRNCPNQGSRPTGAGKQSYAGGAEGEVGEPGRAGAALHLEKSVAEQGGQEMA